MHMYISYVFAYVCTQYVRAYVLYNVHGCILSSAYACTHCVDTYVYTYIDIYCLSPLWAYKPHESKNLAYIYAER